MIEKITVAEYSNRTGKSKQSIYKRINKGTLKSVEEVYNGKKTTFIILGDDNPQEDELNPQDNPILTQATEKINPKDNPKEDELNRDNQPNDNQADNPQSAQSYLRVIEILNEQLKEKDKQIENLQALNNQLSAIALRAQELEARTQSLLGEPKPQPPIEEDTEEPTEPEEPEQTGIDEDKPEEPEETKKRGFWSWLLDL